MSNKFVSKESVLLGMGDVYVAQADPANYSEINPILTSANLFSRMKDVRIYSKKDLHITKSPVNGILYTDEVLLTGIEMFLEFSIYEHNARTQASIFGGNLTDLTNAMSSIIANPLPFRFEVCFTFPINKKKMWYVFPKCISITDLDFAPTEAEGFTSRGVFQLVPAVSNNAVWYSASTPIFNVYFSDD
jgi:hypothetical protein